MKKRILSLFLIFVFVFSLVPSAFAEGTREAPSSDSAAASEPFSGSCSGPESSVSVPESTPSASAEPDTSESTSDSSFAPESSAEPEPSAPTAQSVTLSIDSAHTYGDMDCAFENGYTPKIVNHQALFTLPLKSNGSLQNDRITVSLEFGTGSERAFVAASYEKSFSLTQTVPNNGSTAEDIFLASFSVQMLTERVNGVYPITAHIRAADIAGNPIAMDYTVFVTVADGRPSEPPEPIPTPEPKPEKPTAEPVVYISKVLCEPAQVQAGEKFTLTLTLKNSVKTKSVKNMLVTVDTGNLPLSLDEDSNVFPVSSIRAGGETQLVLHFTAGATLPEGRHALQFAFRYDSSQTLNLSSSGICTLTVRQPAELAFDGARLPVRVYIGDTVTVPLTLMNTGKSPLYNCRVQYEIDGLEAGGIKFIGEIPAGESKEATTNLRAGQEVLDNAKGTVTILYEDSFGDTYRQSAELCTHIEKKPEPADISEKEEHTDKNQNWWLFLLIGLVVGIGGGFGIPWIIRDRNQRKEDDLRL